MTNNTVTLGKCVAYLSFAIDSNRDMSGMLPDCRDSQEMYDTVKSIYDDLIAMKKKHERTPIPAVRCSSTPFLKENARFFVAHSLVEPRQKTVENQDLIKHLNNCYFCFQIYSQFYKDFYQAKMEIKQKLGGT